MSLHDGRIHGKRSRKPQNGNSNRRERWKYLSTDINDVIAGSTPQMRKGPIVDGKSRSIHHVSNRDESNLRNHKEVYSVGYDIDGDGQVDIQEMRMAKLLDSMIDGTQKDLDPSQLDRMRQKAGRLLMANEFIERNQGQLWRYGSIFADKNEKQSAEFIAGYHQFPKLLAYLESVERKRVMRSSRYVRGVLNQPSEPSTINTSPFYRQTWVESAKKIQDPHISKFPLPDLYPKPKPREVVITDNDNEVQMNNYGAIDVDGDGIIDFDEMKLHLRLKAATLNNSSVENDQNVNVRDERKAQQLAGRRMMAADFVTRNYDQMWLYDSNFKGQTVEEIVDTIAASDQFAREFNKWRTKERMLTLKSSVGVANCIVQSHSFVEPSNDPSGGTEFRRVRDRTELLAARKELLKPPEQRYASLFNKDKTTINTIPFGAVREERQTSLPRARSQCELGNLPVIYDAPRRLETIGNLSISKWNNR